MSNPLSTVGLMLTLAGLVGSFFYIQLSNWLRDILALLQKVELNKRAGDENQKKAIVESRIEYRKLATWHTYAVNASVIAFVTFVLVLGLCMIRYAATDPMQPYVLAAFVVFLILFLVLSLGLMFLGYSNAQAIKTHLDKIAAEAKKP